MGEEREGRGRQWRVSIVISEWLVGTVGEG